MNLIARIQDKIREVKREGKEPDIIWLGRDEKKELEGIMKDGEMREVKGDKKKNKFEVLGIEARFVYAESWLSIGCKV